MNEKTKTKTKTRTRNKKQEPGCQHLQSDMFSNEDLSESITVGGRILVSRFPLVPQCVCKRGRGTAWHQGHMLMPRGNSSPSSGWERRPKAQYNYLTIMRRRSTFVHDPTLDVNPQQLYVSADRFVIDQLKAAREERLTFGFNELPEEVISLESTHHASCANQLGWV